MLVAGILDPILHGLASDAVRALAQAIAKAAQALLSAIYGAVSGATAVNPEASWFSGGPHSPVGIVASIAGAVLVLLFLLQVARSWSARRGPGSAGR
jgi:hypothetical protein